MAHGPTGASARSGEPSAKTALEHSDGEAALDDGPPLQSRASDGRVSRRMKAVDRWMDPTVLYPARLHQGKQFFLIVQEPRPYSWIKAPSAILIQSDVVFQVSDFFICYV